MGLRSRVRRTGRLPAPASDEDYLTDSDTSTHRLTRPILSRLLRRNRRTPNAIPALPAPPAVYHYAAIQRSFRTDIARARALLDERAPLTRMKRARPMPGWAKLLFEGDAFTNHARIDHTAPVHLLHVAIAYCACVRCLSIDAADEAGAADDLPQSLSAFLADEMGSDNEIPAAPPDSPRRNTQMSQASPTRPPRSPLAPSLSPRMLSAPPSPHPPLLPAPQSPKLTHSSKPSHSPPASPRRAPDRCSLGSHCVLRDSTTVHQLSPARAELVALPSATHLADMCGGSTPADFELGVVRRGLATFTGTAATLCTQWDLYFGGAKRADVLRAATHLAATRPGGAERRFALQGRLYRFALEAGVHHGAGGSVGVAFRGQTVVIMRGEVVLHTALGAVARAGLPLYLGFGEDEMGAAGIFEDGALGQVC